MALFALMQRAMPKLHQDADAAFGRLATADEDLFANLSRIGQVLSDEATDIANLLLGGQDRLATERITSAQRTLLPLRRELSSAMSQLQRVEASMGFVPASRSPRAGPHKPKAARRVARSSGRDASALKAAKTATKKSIKTRHKAG